MLLVGGGLAWWSSRPVPAVEVYAGPSGETGTDAAADPDSQLSGSTEQPIASATAESASDSGESAAPTGTVVVYVVGQVRHPGVVSVPGPARLADVVAAAGGLTKKADPTAVNLARLAVDGEQVTIPKRGAATPVAPETAAAGDQPENGPGAALIDLNTADATAFETLPGIGPALAQRIVEWRQSNGPFSTVDQLEEVAGIGEVTFARLRDLVTV